MAAALIYANVRDHVRDHAIAAARASFPTDEVANQFRISPSAVRAAVRRVKAAKSYTLFLVDTAGKRTSVGTIVTHRGFTAACVAAFRTYGEFFRGLEIPGWCLIDDNGGCNTLETVRKIAARTADLSAEPEVDLL
jgi:hypothetical protein